LTGVLKPDSNVQFGEGGAGAFSDGKLNTQVHDKEGRNAFVLKTFVNFGADPLIMYDPKPHVGTDKLVSVVYNLRKEIVRLGGDVRFETCFLDYDESDGYLQGIWVEDLRKSSGDASNREYLPCEDLILAIGHSARDTFRMLNDNHLYMEQKAFAVGLRVIHDQRIIDNALHHNKEILGRASYKVTHITSEGRGVYSFCMCPGGYVINSSSEEGRLVVNGMSNYNRDSGYANSAIVVTVDNKDFGNNLFDGMKFQEELEHKTYELGKGSIPVQYYGDFVDNKISNDIHTNGIIGKYISANLNDILPEFLSSSIKEGIESYSTRIKGFNNRSAILCGTETRTSSPVRIVRDQLDGQSNIHGIYPCGEGAGYAGGITSAAVDGIKQAENLIKIYKNVK
jgi:uncharacterized FAD-dependent dehydrogenase